MGFPSPRCKRPDISASFSTLTDYTCSNVSVCDGSSSEYDSIENDSYQSSQYCLSDGLNVSIKNVFEEVVSILTGVESISTSSRNGTNTRNGTNHSDELLNTMNYVEIINENSEKISRTTGRRYELKKLQMPVQNVSKSNATSPRERTQLIRKLTSQPAQTSAPVAVQSKFKTIYDLKRKKGIYNKHHKGSPVSSKISASRNDLIKENHIKVGTRRVYRIYHKRREHQR